METIGKRIKRIRSEREFSLKDLSERSGIPLSTIREWEAGRQIKGEPYEKIARALDVHLTELLTGKQPNPRDIHIKLHEIEMACKFIRDSLKSLDIE